MRLFFQPNFTVEVRSEIRSHICASRFPLKKRLFFHLLNVTRQRSRRRRRLHILIRLQNDMRGHAKRSGSLLSQPCRVGIIPKVCVSTVERQTIGLSDCGFPFCSNVFSLHSNYKCTRGSVSVNDRYFL